jgi:DNA (cytosine-5)-methyltransferase 1
MRYASVCDGIGAAHVAWKPLGWTCSWTSEIEPFPAAVVDHHFGFPNVGDMTKITEEMLNGYGPVELLVGGTPCQSFSVAGL